MVKANSIWHGIGFGMLLSVVLSTLSGWLGINDSKVFFLFLFLISYLSCGYLVAYLNPKHPYTLAAVASVVLCLFNQALMIFLLAPGVLTSTIILNLSLLFAIVIALIGAMLSDKPWLKGKKVRNENAS